MILRYDGNEVHMKLRLIISFTMLSIFLTACEIDPSQFNEAIQNNSGLVSEIETITGSAVREIEDLISAELENSGLEQEADEVESATTVTENTAEESDATEDLNPEGSDDSTNNDPSSEQEVTTSEESSPSTDLDTTESDETDTEETPEVITESGVTSSGIEESDSSTDSTTSGGGSSSGGTVSTTPPPSEESTPEVVEVVSVNDLLVSYRTTLSTRYSYNFMPGETMSGIVTLSTSDHGLTSLVVVIAFTNNPDLELTAVSSLSGSEIVVQGTIPRNYVAEDYYQRATIRWTTADDQGELNPNWPASNGYLHELPSTTALSLEPYFVLPRPTSVDSGLIEEPLFAYAYEIESGIYKVATVNVITLETVMQDNGRYWGLVMVGQGHPENGIWIETSYSGAYRNKYAGIGDYYILAEDRFVSTLTTPEAVSSETTESGLTLTESGLVESGITVTDTEITDSGTSITDSGLLITDSGITESGLSNQSSTPPVITLLCSGICTNTGDLVINVGETFVDPGYSAISWDNELLEVTVSGVINVDNLGSYIIDYTAIDGSGLSSTVSRNVIVKDMISPEIIINGDNSIEIEINTPYVELGATAKDNYDSSIITTFKSSVDVSRVGSYTVTYSAVDSSKNQSSVTRVVNVVDTNNPELVLDIVDAFDLNYPLFDLNSDLIPFNESSQVTMDSNNDYFAIGESKSIKANGARTGSVALFNLRDRNYVRILEPESNTEMSFGNRVKIINDYVVVSAPMDNLKGYRSGSIYIYKISDPNYLRIITPSDGRTELRWGNAISMNDDYIVVGSRNDNSYFTQAGAVYVYRFDDETYEHKFFAPVPSQSAFFGISVSINSENLIAIGAHHESREFRLEGAVYLYDLNTLTHVRKITPSESKDIYRFGSQVEIDSNHLLVSTDNTREVYLYSLTDLAYERIFIETVNQKRGNINTSSRYGSLIALHDDYIIVAAVDYVHEIFENTAMSRGGSVFIYNKYDEQFRKELIAPEAHIEFGQSLFFTEDAIVVRGRERLTPDSSSFNLFTVSLVGGTSVTVTDDSPYTVELFKDSSIIDWPMTGVISQAGSYKIVVTDTSENSSSIEFTND
jgi:hypothetical protein